MRAESDCGYSDHPIPHNATDRSQGARSNVRQLPYTKTTPVSSQPKKREPRRSRGPQRHDENADVYLARAPAFVVIALVKFSAQSDGGKHRH